MDGGAVPRLRPWIARALLARPQEQAARWALRAGLVCQPLAAALLARCLELEAGWRTMSCRRLLRFTGARPADVSARQRRFFQDALGGVEYPAAHPARPVETADAWAFATLGELIECLDQAHSGESWLRPARELRDLRNALAHGHPATWRHCELAHSLGRSLLR